MERGWFGRVVLCVGAVALWGMGTAQAASPVLRFPVVAYTTSTPVFEGQHLEGVTLTVGTAPTALLERSDTQLRIALPEGLPPGEYAVTVNRGTEHYTLPAALVVLPDERTDAGTKGPVELGPGDAQEDDGRYLPDRALLLLNPAQLAAARPRWQREGWQQEFVQQPWSRGLSGVCGRALVGLKDTLGTKRTTVGGMNALVSSLYREKTAGFRVSGRMILRGPAGGMATTQPASPPKFQPPAPRLMGGDFRIVVLDTGLNPQALTLSSGTIDLKAARNLIFTSPWANTPQVSDDALERSLDGRVLSSQAVGHGTQVVETLLQDLPGIVVPLKGCDAEGRCEAASLVAGICYAVSLAHAPNPVRVLHLSLGSTEFNPLVYEALQIASKNGILIVTAAGNRRTLLDNPPIFPAVHTLNYEVKGVVSYPPIVGLISVGSVRRSPAGDQPSDFSGLGSWVTLYAPGEDLPLHRADSTGLANFSGTSFAAPQVTAWLASLLAQHPEFTPAQAIEALRADARAVSCGMVCDQQGETLLVLR